MRKSFRFERGMYEIIRDTELSDKDEGTLYRAIIASAFGGDAPELTKITKPMASLIGLMIDRQSPEEAPAASADPSGDELEYGI